MFNKEVKEQYIEESKNRNSVIEVESKTIFNKIQPFEEKLNKDACNFTSSEIMNMYSSLFTHSLESLMYTNSMLKQYTNYCINQSLVPDHQNHYIEFQDLTMLMKCVNTAYLDMSIITRENLIKILDEDVINPCERLICLALFEGICGKEMIELTDLKLSDFKEGKVYLASGRILDVSDNLFKYAIQTSNTDTYRSYNENNTELPFDRYDVNLLKRMPNYSKDSDAQSAKRRRVLNKIVKLEKVLGNPAFRSKQLQESGRIYAINKLKEETGCTTQEALRNKEIEYRYGYISSMRRYIIKYGKFLGEE